MVHICIGVIEDCQNPAESYGEICVGCNKCGRFDWSEEENVKYSISLCLAILHEYDLAFGATINDRNDPVPVIVDLKNGSVYALHDKIINENTGKEESGEKEKPI